MSLAVGSDGSAGSSGGVAATGATVATAAQATVAQALGAWGSAPRATQVFPAGSKDSCGPGGWRLPGPHPLPHRGLRRVSQRAQVKLDHLGILHQFPTRSGVGITALVQDVRPVADLQAAACVLLDHDH